MFDNGSPVCMVTASGPRIVSSAVRSWVCTGLTLGVAVGATSCGQLVRGDHPEPVVGRWIDATRTTSTDTLIWWLSASGSARLDLSKRGEEPRESPDQSDTLAGPPRRSRPYRGAWYVPRNRGDGRAGELCVYRPGREAASCSQYELDTIMVGSDPMLRLRLLGRPGTLARTTRVLLRDLP